MSFLYCVDAYCGGGTRDTQGLSGLSQRMEQEEDTDTEAARKQTAAERLGEETVRRVHSVACVDSFKGTPPGIAGTTRGKRLHGSTSRGFCVRENEKKVLTIRQFGR